MKSISRIAAVVSLSLGLSLFALSQGSITGKKGGEPKGKPQVGSKGSPPRNEAPPKKQDDGRKSDNSGRSEPPRRQEQPVPSSGSLTGKRDGTSRSGSVSYGTVHNQAARGRTQGVVITDAPVVASNRKIVIDADRENRVQRGNSGYRDGYYGYDPRWRDDNFWYPHYGFQWSSDRCVPSPFYYYGHLPPYIQVFRVSLGSFSWSACTTTYDWRRDNGRWSRDYRDRDLDDAVNSIEDSFRRGRIRSMSDLVPARGSVLVELDCEGRYRIEADDFYDLLRDAVESTRTLSYDIERVWADRDRATVVARHRFANPWGGSTTQWHTYGLERGRRGYEIEYFKSSRRY